MAVDQLPGQVREFANYLDALLARLDQAGGWCGVFWRRDPDGMRACLDGREVPPWDVVEALLQDLAAEYGPAVAGPEKDHARALHAAALVAYDAGPGARDALSDRLDVMLREQRYAAERQGELARLLNTAGTREEADAIRLDLAWARDDHERATSRCAELRTRIADVENRTNAARRPREGTEAPGTARTFRPGPPDEPAARADEAETHARPGTHAARPGAHAGRAGAPEGRPGARAGEAQAHAGPGAHAARPGALAGQSADASRPLADARLAGPSAFRAPVEQPAVSHDTAEQPSVSHDTAEQPPFSRDPVQQPPVSRVSGESPGSGEPAVAPKQRRKRRGSARFAGMLEEEAAPVAEPPAAVPVAPAPAADGRTPRGARFAGAAKAAGATQAPEPVVEPMDADGLREVERAVETLARLRAEGRSGEAHALLVEAAHWPAVRFPALAAVLQRAGLGADWVTLLWEAASLPADRLVAAADALVAAGRAADGRQILRQGVVRPAAEIGAAVLALTGEGRRREVRALLDAYVRMRTPEESVRSVDPDPQTLVPLLLEAAQGVSDERYWDLVHALRVAGHAT